MHPTHSKTLLPSVLRLLTLNGVEDTSGIKATGPRGHLTKGDVLAFLGRIKSARGSEKADDGHSVSLALATAAHRKEVANFSISMVAAHSYWNGQAGTQGGAQEGDERAPVPAAHRGRARQRRHRLRTQGRRASHQSVPHPTHTSIFVTWY